jgi:hypothetical protein
MGEIQNVLAGLESLTGENGGLTAEPQNLTAEIQTSGETFETSWL